MSLIFTGLYGLLPAGPSSRNFKTPKSVTFGAMSTAPQDMPMELPHMPGWSATAHGRRNLPKAQELALSIPAVVATT